MSTSILAMSLARGEFIGDTPKFRFRSLLFGFIFRKKVPSLMIATSDTWQWSENVQA